MHVLHVSWRNHGRKSSQAAVKKEPVPRYFGFAVDSVDGFAHL